VLFCTEQSLVYVQTQNVTKLYVNSVQINLSQLYLSTFVKLAYEMRNNMFVIYIRLILVKQINKCYKYDNELAYERAFTFYIPKYYNYYKTN